MLTPMLSLSPLDGRYQAHLKPLRPILSEFGLIFNRFSVECHWLIFLAEHPKVNPGGLSSEEKQKLLTLITDFKIQDAESIKSIELTTNHDVKAVEYFLQELLQTINLKRLTPLIHFGCTSEDINNLSYALMFKEARDSVLAPVMQELIDELKTLAKNTANIAMLARTHGQVASPTTLGKELLNIVLRLERQYKQFSTHNILAKWNGAVGNWNAHRITYPELNWIEISQSFVANLGLQWNSYTTQIEPHDWIAEVMHTLQRFNTILIDLNRDLWGYIALDYFSQKKIETEVGSSTMPHKINPIDFENSEGNLGVANALAQHFSEKLPISRWQRDLSDSTVLRNLGCIFGYSMLAYQASIRGIKKLTPNITAIDQSLNTHWEVLTEAIQSVMRRHGIADAYEQLKTFSRGKQITADTLKEFINQLDIPDLDKKRLIRLTPTTYTGYAVELLKKVL